MGDHLGRKLRKLWVEAILTLLILSLISPLFTDSALGYSYQLEDEQEDHDPVQGWLTIRDEHPSSGAYYSAGGQAINFSSSFTLGYIEYSLQKYNNPTGDLVIAIYNVTGTMGSSARPTGNPIVYSDNVVDSSTVGSSWELVLFNFTESGFTIDTNEEFAFALEANSSNFDSGNGIQIQLRTDGTHTGNGFQYRYSAWNPLATNDFVFTLYSIVEGQEVEEELFENFNAFSDVSKSMELSRFHWETVLFMDSMGGSKALGFGFSGVVQWFDSSLKEVEFFKVLGETVNIYSSMIPVFEIGLLDLTFMFFSNFMTYGSMGKSSEYTRGFSEETNLFPSLSLGRELGRIFTGALRFYSSLARGISSSKFLSGATSVFASLATTIDLSVLDLVFTLFENGRVFASVGVGKGLEFILFDETNVFASIFTSFEGIFQDLVFILFEGTRNVVFISTLFETAFTLEMVMAIGLLALILALVAVVLAIAKKRG